MSLANYPRFAKFVKVFTCHHFALTVRTHTVSYEEYANSLLKYGLNMLKIHTYIHTYIYIYIYIACNLLYNRDYDSL